jgi:hypothetical protein
VWIARDAGRGYRLTVDCRFGPLCEAGYVASLDPNSEGMRRTAAWLEEQTGMPRQRILSEVAQEWVGEIVREVAP